MGIALPQNRLPIISWTFADQAMVSASNFLMTVLIARYLGSVEFGRFSLAWLLVLLLTRVQLSLIIAPSMSIGPKQSSADVSAYHAIVLAHALTLAGFAFFVLLGGMLLAAAWFPEWQIEGLALPVAFAAVAFQLQDFARRTLFIRDQPVAAFANDALSYLGKLIALAAAIKLTPMDSGGVLWLIAITSAIPAMLAIPGRGPWRWDREFAHVVTRRHGRFAVWLLAANVVSWLSATLPMTVAAAVLGSWAAGALKAAQTMLGVTNVVIEGAELTAPKWASTRLQRAGPTGLVACLRQIAVLVGGPTAIVAGVAALYPELWLRLIFGANYAEYGNVVRWTAAAYLVFALAAPARIGLNAIEHTSPHLVASILSAIIGGLVVYPFVRTMGVSGAAVVVLISTVIGAGVHLFGLLRGLKRLSEFAAAERHPSAVSSEVAIDE
jgi:O-antigen/teichoic acid export membrane protein